MKIIGITGGIGCGKSTVLKLIKNQYNAYVIMADDLPNSFTKPGATWYYKTCSYKTLRTPQTDP